MRSHIPFKGVIDCEKFVAKKLIASQAKTSSVTSHSPQVVHFIVVTRLLIPFVPQNQQASLKNQILAKTSDGC